MRHGAPPGEAKPVLLRTSVQCATRQLVHEVEEDVSECWEEEEERCEDVTKGYTTKTRCDKWPVTRCEVKKQTNKKHTPETKCKKEPREICAPEGCTMKEVIVSFFKIKHIHQPQS